MSTMYRLVCADCAEEVWLGDIHPDYELSNSVDIIVPDVLSSKNRTKANDLHITELAFFLVHHVSHQLTVTNERGLASVNLHGELGKIGSIEYLVHLADSEGLSKKETLERGSVLPEGYDALMSAALKDKV